ncbi:head completion protein [Synechococcus phage SynMITS9220M01]|nr:head completion protein [Synechococcus phage SynMITS9220M01]
MCRWCDLNENIISWASEEFSIPYVSPVDNRIHRYYPDYLIKVKESTGKIKTYVIEVKPKKQTTPPKRPKRQTKSYIYECQMYAVNQAKWKAAKEFCLDNGVEFKIITENELGIK